MMQRVTEQTVLQETADCRHTFRESVAYTDHLVACPDSGNQESVDSDRQERVMHLLHSHQSLHAELRQHLHPMQRMNGPESWILIHRTTVSHHQHVESDCRTWESHCPASGRLLPASVSDFRTLEFV